MSFGKADVPDVVFADEDERVRGRDEDERTNIADDDSTGIIPGRLELLTVTGMIPERLELEEVPNGLKLDKMYIAPNKRVVIW